MKKKALISIVSNQYQGENEFIEVVTPGELHINDGIYEATYEETEISGMEGTTTTIKVSSDEVVLDRVGSTSTKMEFKKNNNVKVLYNTPYGIIDLKINTRRLDIDMNDDGGEIQIDYNLSISGQPPQDTKLIIKINSNNN